MIFPKGIRLVYWIRLVDWGNWRTSWGINLRQAQEVRRKEGTCPLNFWLLHAQLLYNSLQNDGPMIGMRHKRQTEY